MPDPVLKTAQELTARPSLAATDILITAPGTTGVAGKTTVGQLAASADFVDAVAEALNVWQEFSLGVDGATEVQVDPTVDRGSIEIDWGDGTSDTATSGVNVTHTYAAAFTGDVTIKTRPQAPLTELRLTGDHWAIPAVSLPRELTSLRVVGANSTVTGSLTDFPAGLTFLYLGTTATALSGDVADLPTGLTYLNLGETAVALSGDVADLPPGLTYLNLGNTQSSIGGDVADLPAGLASLIAYNVSTVAFSGAAADLPAGLTYLHIPNTSSAITGEAVDLPTGLTYFHVAGTPSAITWTTAGAMQAMNNRLDLSPVSGALTAAEVNRALVDIVNANTTPFLTKLIDLGTPHAAPDATSGGLDGLAAKATLEGRGWTVTTS